MAKGKKNKKLKNAEKKTRSREHLEHPVFSSRVKRMVGAIVMMLLAIVVCFSFFDKAGSGGQFIFRILNFAIGKTIFFVPALLFGAAFLVLKPREKGILSPTICALFFMIVGIAAVLNTLDGANKGGGFFGFAVSWPFLKYFGITVSLIAFNAFVLIGLVIFWEYLLRNGKDKEEKKAKENIKEGKPVKTLVLNEPEKAKFELKPIFDLTGKKREAALVKTVEQKSRAISAFNMPKDADYKRPPLSLFDTIEEKPASGDTNYNALVIKKTLQTFGLDVEMAEVNIGPTVTQYTLKPADGVKLAKITALNNDLALSLSAHPIRIEAPIPGRPLVGVEVPNKVRAAVKIGNLVALDEFQNVGNPLNLILGKDVMGKPIFVDLGAMPHMLVAGATGSGKTICLNSLILSLICRNSPKLLRFVLIDPKRVEFPVYSNLPHLLAPVIVESQKAVNALAWLVGEMERRFDILKELGARDIGSYNKTLVEKPKRKEEGFNIMPYIVLVIDELADLMAARGRDVEAHIVRLSQLARAVGIHLIVATQRPSVEVITGLIKANITSRIAFQVASQVDSRTILDTAGAEKLLGKGDMLYISSEFSKPKRIQGVFISAGEIKKIVNFIAKENATEEKEEIIQGTNNELPGPREFDLTAAFADDPLFAEAKQVVIDYKKASASLLQRRLKIGYARAARLLDLLEEQGVVGPQDGARPREILIASPATDRPDDGFHDPGKLNFN